MSNSRSDIVSRLREAGDTQDGNWSIYDDAADEIEQLRSDLAEMATWYVRALRSIQNEPHAAKTNQDAKEVAAHVGRFGIV